MRSCSREYPKTLLLTVQNVEHVIVLSKSMSEHSLFSMSQSHLDSVSSSKYDGVLHPIVNQIVIDYI